ncbi:LacI family DNA-binding transcriptional regulator [Propionibacteriaceae bacterium Y2011]
MGGPTLRAVALRAGVSVATASRALNPGRSASSEARDRVRAAAEELGYTGDPRQPRQRPALGVVVPVMSHQVIDEIIVGVEAATDDAGRYCMFSVSRGDAARELALLAGLVRDERVGGIILVGGFQLTADYARAFIRTTKEAREAGKPIVLCGRAMTADAELVVPGVTVLDYNNEGGSAAAVGLLLSRSHTVIGLVRGPVGMSTSDARSRGYRQALAHFGIEHDAGLIRVGQRDADHGYEAATSLLADRPDITAIFAESDEMAMGVLQAAHDAGRSVPDTLSVVGFDDQRNSRFFIPPLTTVHMPFAELGRRAARIALEDDTAHRGEQRLIVGTHLIMRQSVAAPPGQPA